MRIRLVDTAFWVPIRAPISMNDDRIRYCVRILKEVCEYGKTNVCEI
jgi:hypothetical protein